MLDRLPPEVVVYEVGPRDGLQNEAHFVETADKVRLIEALAASGLNHIEIGSFVSPKWIPQLADGKEVASLLRLPKGVKTSALVPNLIGLERAKEANLKEIAVFMSATESHSKKNINKSIDEALHTLGEVVASARKEKMRVRAYLSVVFYCPYEGKVQAAQSARVAERLIELGVDELSLGDTIGHATPNQVKELIALVGQNIDLSKLALHMHDTLGMALANVLAGLECGITIFDSAVGGMGGCPYAPGASGNLATEDLIYLLHGLGIKTGVDLEKLVEASFLAQEIVGRKLPGRYLQASLAAQNKECAIHE